MAADGSGSGAGVLTVELRKHCQARKAALLQERVLHEPLWRQVAEYIDPFAGMFLQNNARGTRTLPSRAKIINSSAAGALRTMDAGFMGGHTSKSRPWFRITVANPALAELPEVKAWCDDVAQAIRDILERSNFYTALPMFYHYRHLFGAAAMTVLEDEVEVVRFSALPMGTFAIGLNKRGQSDTTHREYEESAKVLKERYGLEALPQRVRDALTNNRVDQLFTVQSLIEPNERGLPGYQAKLLRPFRQIDWIDGSDSDPHGCLKWEGHYENPVLASRWDAHPGMAYGTSPAIDALGDIKQLQYLEGEKLRLQDMTSKPALQLPESLRNRGASLNPGERVFVTPMQTQQKVEPIYTPDPRAMVALQAEIDRVTARIERVFYADLFRMLDFLDDRQRTAYEISERKEEKVAMLGPALESLTDEVLDPNIVRVYSVADRRGLLPPVPEQLDNMPLRIEYTSMLAQAQKAAGTGTIERVIMFAGQLAQATGNTTVWDKIDTDQAIDEVADRQGSPARIVRSDDQVAEMREQRQEQQRMAQMAQMAKPMKDMAGAAKDMASVVPQEGSMLTNAAESMAQ